MMNLMTILFENVVCDETGIIPTAYDDVFWTFCMSTSRHDALLPHEGHEDEVKDSGNAGLN